MSTRDLDHLDQEDLADVVPRRGAGLNRTPPTQQDGAVGGLSIPQSVGQGRQVRGQEPSLAAICH